MDWLNLLIFFCLIAGNTTLWVTYVNRTHAIPLQCATLHRLRRVHDVMLFLVPALLIVLLGFSGPKLLLGGSWSDVARPWWGVILLCFLGFVGLVFATLRHRFSRPPSLLIDQRSEVIEISKELGHLPVQPGKYEKLARLSLNQQFLVEVNEKTFRLPSLPEDLDGLTILHLSDWHLMGTVDKEFFQAVCQHISPIEVDLICFTGDLIDNMDCLSWLPTTLGQLSGKYGNYYILGNHDWYQQPDVIRNRLRDMGWIDVASQTIRLQLEQSSIEIGGDETPWMGTAPTFQQEQDFRLLLCHMPDHFQRAQTSGVHLMLSGHNHGGQVQLPLIGPVYSPSRFGTKYASGIFWQEPTLMHVSRGLSGRHPFRYRCLPEITKITLHAEE